MFEVEDLHAGYSRVPVVRGVSLKVAPGEMIAVLGNNGVGKSTLLRALIGLIPCTSGTVRLGDRTLTPWPSHRRVHSGLAYVPQGRGLAPQLTVRENLLVAAHGLSSPARAAEEAIQTFPALRARGDERAGSLSGGLQQIVAVARSLVRRPQVLLLDEPSEGVAPAVLDEIGQHLREMNKETGFALLLVEQNIGFAAGIAERVCFMRRGEVVKEIHRSGDAQTWQNVVENEFIASQVG